MERHRLISGGLVRRLEDCQHLGVLNGLQASIMMGVR